MALVTFAMEVTERTRRLICLIVAMFFFWSPGYWFLVTGVWLRVFDSAPPVTSNQSLPH